MTSERGTRAGRSEGEGGPKGPRPEEAPPEPAFAVQGARVAPYQAAPTLRFDLEIDSGRTEIRSLSLSVQLRIAAPRRRHDRAEEVRLYELFGAPRDWGRSLRSLLWTRTNLVVPPFRGRRLVELDVPCTYDFDVTASKYLHAVRDGEIPLEFLFGGSVFYRRGKGPLRTVRLSWDRECAWTMPASLWHELMERYFPNSAWLRVRRDVFDRLLAYRSDRGLLTWEAALEDLLPSGAPSSGRPS